MNNIKNSNSELSADNGTKPFVGGSFEIHYASYWEHFKAAQDLSRYLPPEHPKRITIENEMNKILTQLHENT